MSNNRRPLSLSNQKDSSEPPPKRQKITHRLMKQFENTLQGGTFSDVKFIVGPSNNTQTFDANKLVFSTHSPVFKAMLFGPMTQSSPIEIPDVKPLAFDYLHKLFYMKEPQLTYDIIMDVLHAAQKYLIDIVIDECKQKLYSINNINDLYLVLRKIAQYSPSVFQDMLQTFFRNTQFISENTQQVIADQRFNTLQPFIVQNIIDSNIISSEIIEYELAKNYCIEYKKSNSNNYDSWQSVFKNKFTNFVRIKLRRLSTEYLLDIVKNDNIISANNLLEIINDKRNIGFKLSDVLLTYPQRTSLKVGDLVDLRDRVGHWYEAKVTEKNTFIIKMKYIRYDVDVDIDIDDWSRIAKHKSVTNRKYISRPCMRNLLMGDYIYINCAYHPIHGKLYENKWTKHQISDFNLGYRYRFGITIDSKPYAIHPDSQNECTCMNDTCEYCYKDL